VTKLRWAIQAVEDMEAIPSDPQIREVIEPPYRIVYRVRDDAPDILTVFRASRLLPSVLGD